MVLVSYKLDNYVSILQTKLSHRERYEARRIGLEAMPLDQHIEGGHGECQAGLKVLPAPVHDFLEVADHRQHREHRLHQHAVLPRTALTQLAVYLHPADKYYGLTRRPSQGQKDLEERALRAS